MIAVWGANFVASKIALEHFPPVFSTFLRFSALGLLLLPFVKRPHHSQLRFIAILSVLGTLHFSLPQASLAEGTDIATCAILCQLGVPFSCLFGAIFLRDRLGWIRVTGLIISFIGVIIVFGAPNIATHPLGEFFAVASAFFFGIYNVLLKRLHHISVMQLLAWLSLFMTPQLLLWSWLQESPTLDMIVSAPSLPVMALAFTVIFSTILGHGLWYFLMKTYDVSKVAPFALLVPIAGVGFGQLFYNEPLSWQLFVGGVVTLLGVAVIVFRRPKLVVSGESV